MGTIADKLNLLRKTKENIKSAIEEKGQTVGDIPFAQYPNKIRAISGGGGTGGGASTPPDPEEVYKATRPTDWLPMPEPKDDEMYLLVHIPDGVSALLAFTVTCASMHDYYVRFGTVEDGRFVQKATRASGEEPVAGIPSGEKFETELFADDFGNLTSDGFKQVMVKISGTDILTWEPSEHSKTTGPQGSLPIVEISCRLPKGEAIRCGIMGDCPLTKLRYFTWSGENAVTNMSYMFAGCSTLAAIPQLNTANVTDMSYMFELCYALTTIPQLNTANVTNMSGMFESCYALAVIPQLDTSVLMGTDGTFNDCYSLASIKFVPSISGWGGANIDLSGCSLGHKAIVDFFESLPAISSGTMLFLNGNPGVPELTYDEEAIATDKGWNLDV